MPFVPGPSAPVPPLSTIRPALKDLVCYAVPRVAPKWYEVGLQLDLKQYDLDAIEREKPDCPRKMFAKWLEGPSCSWQSVFNAVEKICGAKPMEDIRTAVVESIIADQTSGEHACLSLCHMQTVCAIRQSSRILAEYALSLMTIKQARLKKLCTSNIIWLRWCKNYTSCIKEV